MKIKIDEFRTETAQPVEAPLDFTELCAILAACQAATPTARLARHEEIGVIDHIDHANPAVAVLLAVPGREIAGGGGPASFHAAAAARFTEGVR